MVDTNRQAKRNGKSLRRDDLKSVRQSSLFAKMHAKNFASLMEHASLRTISAKTEILSESDPAEFLFVVHDGCIELFAGTNHRETTIALVRPVSTFALAAALNDTTYLLSARTVHQSRLLAIPAHLIRAMFIIDTDFAQSVVTEVATCYRGAIKSLKNHKLRTGTERLANYVLACSETTGRNGAFRLDLHKRKLASVLGMTPENLSRAFATLKSHGVRVEGQDIAIDDIALLRELAQPTPMIDDWKH